MERREYLTTRDSGDVEWLMLTRGDDGEGKRVELTRRVRKDVK